MRSLVPLGILLLGLGLATVASADVTIRMKETRNPGAKKPEVSTGSMMFNANCLASRWDAKDRNRMIFRGDKGLLWIIDDAKKSYQEVDKATIDQMAEQMAGARSRMQERLAQLPPEQRAQAEAMMKKYNSAPNTSRVDYRKMGQTRVINGQLCTLYDHYSGKELEAHLWVAPYSALRLSPSDGAVFQKMGEFTEKLTTSIGGSRKQDYIPMHELGGIPLFTQNVSNGKVTAESQVESVSRAPILPGSFDLPAGYKAQPMPELHAHK